MENFNNTSEAQFYANGGTTVQFASPPYRKKSSGKTAIIVVSIIFGLLALMVIIRSISGSASTVSRPTEDYLARIYVVGEISATEDPYSSSYSSYHHSFTINSINDLMLDNNNRGILLYVDTPGGTVYESDDLYLKLEEYKEVTGRPIYVYMGSMAASGGYYISVGADKIYANRNTWTGSIGVIIGTLFDVSEFLEKNGIKATEITSGKNKGMGGYFEPMSDEQRQIFQALVDEAYDQFVGIVAEGRGMTVEEVRAISDGRIYTAKQAVENGLIDEIASEDDALIAILTDLGNNSMRVYDMEYTPMKASVFDLLAQGSGVTPKVQSNERMSSDVAAVLELMQSDGDVPIKYLYQG